MLEVIAEALTVDVITGVKELGLDETTNCKYWRLERSTEALYWLNTAICTAAERRTQICGGRPVCISTGVTGGLDTSVSWTWIGNCSYDIILSSEN